MSNEAIDWAIKQPVKGHAARKLILLLLANRANDEWVCWPGRRLLAEESGLSLAQVGKHLQTLEEDGLIQRVAWERTDGGQGANCYVLGPIESVTPSSFSSRGGGRIRAGGSSFSSTTPTRERGPKNPQEKSTGKPSDFAAREESRRRASAEAAASQPTPTRDDLCKVIREAKHANPDAYGRQIETIRSRAPRLWRDAREKAIDQYKDSGEPEKAKNANAVDVLAYQYVIHMRAPNWPAWLLGPLLHFLPSGPTAQDAA